MRARKTIEVKPIIELANKQLARTDEYADFKFKCGVSVMVEQIL